MLSLFKCKSDHVTPLLKTLHYTKGDTQVLHDPWFAPSPPLGLCTNVALSMKPCLIALFKITTLFPACTTYPPSLVYFYP